tara:strand:+ start:546 stop:1145 length:600 start_codon:yes stop_codon:yes gene_type:complete
MATNFPKKGDDKKISLRNSEEKQFPYEFAKNLKEQQPKIWKAGGNIRGNEAFMLWGRARKGEDTESIRAWIKERESWAKRHFRDGQKFKGDVEPNLSNVAGVVAQIKWGVIGNLGVQGMKDVINKLAKKLDSKNEVENARRNPNCPDGWEHQMPDGSWMCGKRHGGGGYNSCNEKELLSFLNIMKEDLITEIKLIKKNK